MQQWQMMQQQQQMFDLNTPLSEVYASAMHVQLAQRPATNGVAPSRSLSHQWPAVRGPYVVVFCFFYQLKRLFIILFIFCLVIPRAFLKRLILLY